MKPLITPRVWLGATTATGVRRALRWSLTGLISIVVWLVSASPTSAQSYLVKSYTVDDDLPSREVYQVAHDALGRMWFITRNELVVYDGLHWTPVSEPKVSSGARASKILAGADGRMWMTSSNPDELLTSFAGDRWEPLTAIQSYRWASAPSIFDEGIPIVTAFAELELNGVHTLALGLGQSGLLLWQELGWTYLTREQGLPDGGIVGLAGHDGQLVILTDHSLTRWADSQFIDGPNSSFSADDSPLLALYSHDDWPDSLWVLAQDRIYRIQGDTVVTVVRGFELRAKDSHTSGLLVDPQGCIFFGQRFRLFHADLGMSNLEVLGRQNGMSADGLLDLDLDSEDNLWVVNLRGVSKLVSMRFASLGHRHGLLQDEVSALVEVSPGQVLAGHNDGLTVITGSDLRRIEFTREGPFMAMPPRAMDLDRGSRGIWIAGSYKGLGQWSGGSDVEWFKPPKNDWFVAVLDTSSGVLVGGANLYRFENGRFEDLGWKTEDWGGIRKLSRRSDGTILVVSNAGGLSTFTLDSLGEFTEIERPEGLLWRNAFTALEDSRGRIWLGTLGGLLEFDGQRLVQPRAAALRFSKPVYQLLEDHQGDLWIGTDDGVCRWDGTGLRWYSRSEGLSGRETNRSAAMVDEDGQVWIGTETGLSLYRADHDWQEFGPPKVRITAIEGATPVAPGLDEMRFEHDDNTLTLRFAAVSLRDENGLRYRYRLTGIDEDWSETVPAHQRSARYAHLPAGDYRFEVQSRNGRGAWSEGAVSGVITIERPFWETWWFRTLGLFLFAVTIAAGILIVARWRYATRLEQENRLRRAAEDRAAGFLSEIEASRADFVAIAEKGRDGLLVVDADEVVQFANSAACTLLRQKREQIVGTSLDFDLEAGEEIPIIHGNDEPGIGELRTAPTDWKGEASQLVLIRDVTEQKQTEEHLREVQKLEAVGKLAGGVAHDFNNLLQALLSLVASLRLAKGDADRRLILMDELESHVKLGTAVTRRLLLFSRRDPPVRGSMDLRTAIEESMALVNRLLRANIRLVVELGEIELPVEADRNQLNQVVTNLAVNANDAMENGGTLTVRAGADNDDHVWFEIEDTGAGIPPELRDRIFEPFFTTKGRERGTGLGLSVVHGIVTQHGGTIDAESQEGRGSRFRVVLPTTQAAVAEVEVIEHTTAPAVDGKGEYLLLVEDDDTIRNGLSDVLTSSGYRVVTAASAEAAELLELESLDLLVTDLVLPGQRGDQLARSLRERWPELPVVIMSGHTEDETTQLALQVEAVRFLYKPFPIDRLTGMVREAIDHPSSGSWAVVREAPPGLAAHRILIVEDDVNILALMSDFLSKLGYDVIAVASAEQAQATVEKVGFELGLVITDLALPGMDGAELFARCRRLQPRLPFIFSSGDPYALQQQNLRGKKNTRSLPKPFDVFDLKRVVQKFLKPPAKS